MKGHGIGQLYIKVLMVLFLVILQIYSGNIASASNAVTVKLTDNEGQPVRHVKLTAWRVGVSEPQDSSHTNKEGNAVFDLGSGEYYVTGNVSKLKRLPAYATSLQDYDETTLYFISNSFAADKNAEPITLAVDETKYIDMADIAGRKGFNMYISQVESGINTIVTASRQDKWLRLYLPIRLLYTVRSVDGDSDVNRAFYAAPGMQLIVSSY